ncbi:MAG TPA: serine/threonine-protein kinase [Anaerolineae bacterium]|nr:serine/threonine-protein kinase [Anaerolineae bacterium]
MELENGVAIADVAASICSAHRLVLGDCLGSGAFKTAYRANDSSGVIYALKIIRSNVASPRTNREVQAVRRCDHRCIARLYEVGSHPYNGSLYEFIIEEYIDGGMLTSRLESDGQLDDEELLSLGSMLIDALAHLAGRDLVHRDIKPDNIIYRAETGEPVLVDFGLVRDLAAPSLTPSHLPRGPGTPYFAAPEQLNNQKHLIDWRTDQFSLGVVLYFARFRSHPYHHTGEPIYARETVERVAVRGSRGETFNAVLEESQLRCLDKMTRAWPIERYRTPQRLALAWEDQRIG